MFLAKLNDKSVVNLDHLMKFQDGDRSLSMVGNKIFRIAGENQRAIIDALEDDLATNEYTNWVKFGSGVTAVYINNLHVVEVRDFLKYTQISLSNTTVQLREYGQRDKALLGYEIIEPLELPEGVTVLSMDALQQLVEEMPVVEVIEVPYINEPKPAAKAKTTSTRKKKTDKEKA